MTRDTTDIGLGLFTDLYELTMLQGYFEEGLDDTAVFSLFVRRLPNHRNVLLACGLDPVLAYLERLRFTDDDIRYLRSLPMFSEPFLSWLRGFRFTGDVYAVPEGIVKLTAVGDNRTDEIPVSTPSLSARDHQPCGLAVPSLHSQLSRC
jgi:nicotinic acid phosphoribosyltransferase